MFEQSLYNQEPVAQPLQPGELFHNYELKNWDLSTRIYQIVGISAVANILAILIFAQTSVLTTKTCDSPLVGSVCQFLDTVYVGAMIFGTNREYVDEAYEKTELGNADITYVDVTGVTPPLSYPEGYFQLANPQEYAMIQQQAENPAFPPNIAGFPGIPSSGFPRPSTADNIFNTPQKKLKPIRDPLGGQPLPSMDDSGIVDINPGVAKKNPHTRLPSNVAPKNTGGSIAGIPGNVNPTIVPDKKVDPTDPVTENDINPRPFKDLADIVNAMIANKEVDIEKSQFEVGATGKLNKEGKLDRKTFRFTKAVSNDPKIIDVVKKSVEAFNDSGMLKYLKDLSGKDINLSIKQDNDKVSAVVQSELERDTRAKSIANILDLGKQFTINKKKAAIASMQAENKPEKAIDLQNEIDDLALLTNTIISSEGKNLVITFNVEKNIVQQMIQRKLAEQAKAVKKPQSSASIRSNDNTVGK